MNFNQKRLEELANLLREITGHKEDNIYLTNYEELISNIRYLKEGKAHLAEFRDLNGQKTKIEDILKVSDGITFLEEALKIYEKNLSFAWEYNDFLENGKRINLIYVPEEKDNPNFYDKSGNLSLDGILNLSEEIFHAMDNINANHIANHFVSESLAVLARYLTIRYLEEQGYNLKELRNSKFGNEVINKSLGFVPEFKQESKEVRIGGFAKNGEIVPIIASTEYAGRLYLLDFLEDLEKKPYSEVVKEIKEFYQKVRSAKEPMDAVDVILNCKTKYEPVYVAKV